MPFCYFNRKTNNNQSEYDDRPEYNEFETMVDETSSYNDLVPFHIKSRRICSKKRLRCSNREWICEKLDNIIDSLLIITIHIFFISIFEPLFYLNYVVKLEYNFIIDKHLK